MTVTTTLTPCRKGHERVLLTSGRPVCRICRAETGRRWRAKNKDYFREWRAANHARMLEVQRAWREGNRAKVRAYQKAYLRVWRAKRKAARGEQG